MERPGPDRRTDDGTGPWSHRLAPSPLPRVPGTRMRRGRTGCRGGAD
ncbi:hypothetical protein SFR_0985 [Streptomyces sp. FR-008]|nr:hypothetical protein SFR_0985 [Streptomyces sp. FR-008]